MNSGAIAHFSQPGGDLDENEFPKERYEDGEELLSTLTTRGYTVQAELTSYTNGDSLELIRGRAAQEHVVDVQTTKIRKDGTIQFGEKKKEVTTQNTELLYLEGEFVVTNDTESEFAHSLVEVATGGEVAETELDLGKFAADHSEADLWLGGFYDRDSEMDKGGLYGNLKRDDDAQKILNESAINRLGVENFKYNNRPLKFLITESGYVDIYTDNVDTLEFVQFLHDIVVPHIVK